MTNWPDSDPAGAESEQSHAALVEQNLRLAQSLGDGAGPPCSKPWVSLEERSSTGQVTPCCWYRGKLGRIRTQEDPGTIWSGDDYRALRAAMGSGIVPPQCPPTCPLLGARQQWFRKQELHEYSRPELESFDDDFLANRAGVLTVTLAGNAEIGDFHPLRLHLHPSDACNLRCIMCYLDLDSGRKNSWYDGDRLPQMLRYLEDIKIFGGEPFFCKTSRKLILDTPKPPWTHTSFLTNGMLVTERVIDALEGVRIGNVDVSLDAAHGATYERIRLRGNFTKALAGARRLTELSQRHGIRPFPVYANFTIQELNYREIDAFITLCSEHGLIANFSLTGDNNEARRRADLNHSELGVPPRDRLDLITVLEKAIAGADSEFTTRSLINTLACVQH